MSECLEEIKILKDIIIHSNKEIEKLKDAIIKYNKAYHILIDECFNQIPDESRLYLDKKLTKLGF